jgi:HK97 gp10 family phage protein
MASSFRGINRIPETIAVLDEAQDEWLEHMGEAMVKQIDQGFDKGEDALGRPWEPLQDGDGNILIDSGNMRDSIDYQIDEDESAVAVGSNSDYIGHHEFGTENLPRRPILQPAMIWAEEKLISQSGKEKIGNKLDTVTF